LREDTLLGKNMEIKMKGGKPGIRSTNLTVFGEEPRNFALLCFNHMIVNKVRKLLDLVQVMEEIAYFFVKWN
jgi:hypothetical protein